VAWKRFLGNGGAQELPIVMPFNEDDAYFELTRFDGQKIRIFDGKVVNVE
jgi:hypothetical protein